MIFSCLFKRGALTFSLFVVCLLCCSLEAVARKRIVLSRTKPIKTQILTSDIGAMYIVTEIIDLKKGIIKLPQDAILQFEGGVLSNGELVGNNTSIVAGRYEIFKSVSLRGTWTLDGLPVEWFGAFPNNANKDCSEAINLAVMTGRRTRCPALLGSGTYYIKSTIEIPDEGTLIGLSPTSTKICFYASAVVGVYMHGQYTTIRNICVEEYKLGRKGICVKLGDSKRKVSCTRGYVEDIKTIGGDRGLDLEYQWCNKISGVNCRYNNIGLYAYETTPYVENAVIEGNYLYGVLSEGFGIKLYNAIIEGNRVGCMLNGKYNLLNNCYLEGNTASYFDGTATKKRNGVDVEGGNLYAGEQVEVTDLIMIGCHIINNSKFNNTIRVNKCKNFTTIGCNSMKYLEMTKNCTVKYLDAPYGK